MNRLIITRVILTAIIVIGLLVEPRFSYLPSILIFVLLIFDLFEKTHPNNLKNELCYYLSWVTIIATTINIRGVYFGPYTPLYEIAFLKVIIVLGYLIRYKNIMVTRTLLSKASHSILIVYCLEMILNSTHGFSHTARNMTFISSIELILVLIIDKHRLPFKTTILNFLWQRKA